MFYMYPKRVVRKCIYFLYIGCLCPWLDKIRRKYHPRAPNFKLSFSYIFINCYHFTLLYVEMKINENNV